uniref:alpha/beta hydrolase family protein n=1 Tax=uncultured Planktosalinus sp. TaxID=1810935 RepID=UPI0030D8E098
NPTDPAEEPTLFIERNYQDRYSDPGSFVTKRNEYGRNVLEIDNNTIYLIGDGYSPEGKLPFVDQYNLNTKETERLYRAKPNEMLESIIRMIDVKKRTVLTRLESSNQFPNYFIRNIKTNELEQISDFKNPFKAIQDVHKEVITYKREDGLDLSATLYLPVDYDKNKKYPMIMWAYPREFVDASSASQVTSSSKEFTYLSYGTPLYWVNRGYVVLDDAAFPIIGEDGEQPNDTFVEQLVANAKAAIDAVDALGYIDRSRVAVGGHSYGAFMTANLLSHSNLFAAGIARSGAYNRTLTPFGFQAEERNYWEAPEIYYSMSPFMNAEKMKTPLLLIHGEADNNSGTYPMQSERYFNALKGLGAPVRLVMLPNESHGYTARESIMHLLWEQDQWLEKYVKNKAK